MSDSTTIPTEKRCCKCNEIKPAAMFSKDRKRKDGLKWICKSCDKATRDANPEINRARSKSYYQRNRERLVKASCDYQKEHREERNEYNRKWYQANAVKVRASHKAYRERHPDRIKATARAYRIRHADKIRARAQAKAESRNQQKRHYRQSNAALILERWRRYCEEHPQEVAARKRAWHIANPTKVKASRHRRKARIKGNGGYFTDKELGHIEHIQGGKCCYCGRVGLPLTIDHIIPVTQGGPSDIWNLALCCGTCNSSKGDRTLEQWTDRWYLPSLKR